VIRLFLLLAALSPAGAQQIYDLLLKNGNVIDPANHRSGRMDVAVAGNKIARVAPGLPAAHARVVIDASQYYVTPGLVDINGHFDAGNTGRNVQPEHNSLPYGVTTVVDAGGSDAKTFEVFKTEVISHSKTRVLAFLDIAGGDPAEVSGVARKYRDTIVGIRTSPEGVDRAVKAAELSGTIVLVDFPSNFSGDYKDSVLKRLRAGDLQTQVYGRTVPQLDAGQKIQPWMWEARKRGVLFDVGHGSSGLWFRIAVPAIRQGFTPDTISTGLDRESAMLPRATMTNVLSKFLDMGMTLEQLVERTTSNPARAIHRPDLGALTEGAPADIALLEIQRGNFGFLDSGHAKLMGDQRLRCVLTLRNGAVVWDSDGLAATDWIKAGPYSNFK